MRLESYARPEFTSADLQFLPDYRAVARVLRDGQPLRPFALSIDPLPPVRDAMSIEVTLSLALARDRYARNIDDVERDIARRLEAIRRLAEPKHPAARETATPETAGSR